VAGRLSAKPVTFFTALVIWLLAILLAMPAAIFSYVPEIPLEANKTIKVNSQLQAYPFSNPIVTV
jgi:hypothetical protein